MAEKIISTAKAYRTGKPHSLVVVIPKEAAEKHGYGPGTKFLVKVDENRRLIYEPLEK